jgi:NAD(P)-dependent dehydrogenase (short-subunit alcohol dehydrogenase family)
MTRNLDGKVAWITGGGTGIGLATAVELARRGAHVALSGRRPDRLQDASRAVEQQGTVALIVPCDVREDASQRDALARVVDRFGRLDVAVANAGYSAAGRIEALDAETWRRQLDTNVVGAAITARHTIPELERTQGRLALVGSVSGFFAAPGFAPYHASKHAIRALGLTLAMELAGSGVSCTTVHPGFVTSEITRVDNDGRYHAERDDPRPRALMWSAERAARVIVDAIVARRREVVFTGHGRLAAFVGMHLPRVMHAVMASAVMRRQAEGFNKTGSS